MKKIAALIFVFFGMALYADEIYLKNGTVIRGEVKGAGPDAVFYKDEATFHAKEIPLGDVERIVYPEGLTVNPHEKNFDDIYKKDGTIIKAKILRITDDRVIAHGDREIIPRNFPIDGLTKVAYGNGRTISFFDAAQAAIKAQSEGKAQSADKAGAAVHYPPPTHHIDGDMNFYLILLAGMGITRNADINSCTNQVAEHYLDYLQANYATWDNNRVEPSDNPYSPDLNLEIEARLFDDIGFGVGVSGGFSFFMPGTASIVDASGNETVRIESLVFITYCSGTLYLKEYFATRNSMAFYVLAGAGIGYYRGYVSFTISEGSPGASYGTPGSGAFEEDYTGTAIGYHGTLEVGIEQKPVTIIAGMRIRYAEIDELSSGGSVLRLDNGGKASLKLNGGMLYAGIGLLF